MNIIHPLIRGLDSLVIDSSPMEGTCSDFVFHKFNSPSLVKKNPSTKFPSPPPPQLNGRTIRACISNTCVRMMRFTKDKH